MKVKQLIELLQTYNADAEVFYSYDDTYNTIFDMNINSAYTDSENNVHLCSDKVEKESKETD